MEQKREASNTKQHFELDFKLKKDYFHVSVANGNNFAHAQAYTDNRCVLMRKIDKGIGGGRGQSESHSICEYWCFPKDNSDFIESSLQLLSQMMCMVPALIYVAMHGGETWLHEGPDRKKLQYVFWESLQKG